MWLTVSCILATVGGSPDCSVLSGLPNPTGGATIGEYLMGCLSAIVVSVELTTGTVVSEYKTLLIVI